MQTDFHRVRRLPPYVFEQVNRLKAKARAARRRHHRSRHGQSRSAGAEAYRSTSLSRRSASRAPIAIPPRAASRAAPRAGRLLRAPIRREARSRDAGRRDARLEGRLRQYGPGDHRAGRCRAGAQSRLSDPCLRLPDGGRRRSAPCRRDAGRDSSRARARGHALDPEADRGCRLLSVEPDRAMVASLDFYRDLVLFAKKHEIFVLSDLAYAEVYFDDDPPPSILQVPGAFDVAVEFTSMSKTFSMAGLAHGLCGRQRAPDRGAGAGEILSRLRRLYADPGRGDGGAQRAAGLRREMRAIYKRAATCWSRASAAPAGRFRRRARRCSPGRRSRSGSGSRLAEFSKLLIEKADVAVSPGIGFGEHGDGYVRLALVENEQRIRQAARGVRRFFETADSDAAQCGAAQAMG